MTERKVPVLLWVGILLAPYIFAWFLLKPDYGKKAKIVSFAWMVIVLFMFFGRECSGSGSSSAKDEVANHTEESAVRETSDAFEQVDDALPTKSTNWEDYMPDSEKKFIELLKKGWDKEESSYTDIEKYKLIQERKQKINNNYQVSNWVGKINRHDFRAETNEISLGVNLEAEGYSKYIGLYTGASANTNYLAETTIKPSSSYFEKVLEMKSGDIIKFSGILKLKDPEPWSRESDPNPLVSLHSLTFLFKFQKIQIFDIDNEPEPPNLKND